MSSENFIVLPSKNILLVFKQKVCFILFFLKNSTLILIFGVLGCWYSASLISSINFLKLCLCVNALIFNELEALNTFLKSVYEFVSSQ